MNVRTLTVNLFRNFVLDRKEKKKGGMGKIVLRTVNVVGFDISYLLS